MTTRRREFRVRLRSDRVGHEAVMNWLDELERDGRGVAGLQEQLIAVLAAYVEAMGDATEPPRRSQARTVQVVRPTRQREPMAAKPTVETPDPLQLAAQRLEF